MFISSYTTIYFFVKKFIFSKVYISVNKILECLYMFLWVRKGPSLSTYATGNWWGMGGSSEMRSAAYRKKGCHAPCVHTHLHYLFSCIWQYFCHIVSCFICRYLTLPLFKKDVFARNGYFSPTRSISVVMK